MELNVLLPMSSIYSSEVEWTIVIVLILNGKLHNLAEFELKLEFMDWDKVEHL